MSKVLKFPSDGSIQVSTVIRLCFSTNYTSFESLMFLQSLAVVDEYINQNTVVAFRNYLIVNIVWYYVQLFSRLLIVLLDKQSRYLYPR